MRVRIFDSKVEKFISGLGEGVVAKVLRVIDLLEMFGNKLAFPHSRMVAPRLFELRIHGKQEVRIFYTFHKNEAVLLRGFVKKTQRISRKEIDVALSKLKTLDSK